MDGGAGDEGAGVLVAILHLDPKGDFPGIGLVEPKGAFGAVAYGKLPGAFEQDSVPAEITDDCRYLILFVLDRKGEVLPARVWNFMPLVMSFVDIHQSAASGSANSPDASLPLSERLCVKKKRENILGKLFHFVPLISYFYQEKKNNYLARTRCQALF